MLAGKSISGNGSWRKMLLRHGYLEGVYRHEEEDIGREYSFLRIYPASTTLGEIVDDFRKGKKERGTYLMDRGRA